MPGSIFRGRHLVDERAVIRLRRFISAAIASDHDPPVINTWIVSRGQPICPGLHLIAG